MPLGVTNLEVALNWLPAGFTLRTSAIPFDVLRRRGGPKGPDAHQKIDYWRPSIYQRFLAPRKFIGRVHS